MVLHQLLPRYLKAVLYSKISTLPIVEWDAKNKRFVSCIPKWKKSKLALIHMFYVLLILSGIRYLVNDAPTANYANIAGIVIILGGVVQGYCLAIFGYNTDSFPAVPNACLSYEVSVRIEKRVLTAKWYRFVDLALLLWPTFPSNCTTIVALLMIVKPFSPPSLGYLLPPICEQFGETICYGVGFFLFPLQLWALNWFYIMLLYGSVFVFAVPIMLIFRYVRDVIKLTKEMSPAEMIGRYRKILILQDIMNSYFQPYYYTAGIALVCVTNIVTGFTLVNMLRKGDLGSHKAMGFLFFADYALSMAFISGMCGLAGLANRNSMHLIQKLKRTPAVGSRKAWIRELKSLPALKIRYGSNYVDSLTPLTVMGFCVDQTASLLLMK